MELIKQILASFADTLPNDSKTAAAIARGAGPQDGGGQGGLALDSTACVTGAVAGRLKEFRQQLPADCATARLIDGGASLEEISEAAQKEGLTSLASMLFEAEQEADRDS